MQRLNVRQCQPAVSCPCLEPSRLGPAQAPGSGLHQSPMTSSCDLASTWPEFQPPGLLWTVSHFARMPSALCSLTTVKGKRREAGRLKRKLQRLSR